MFEDFHVVCNFIPFYTNFIPFATIFKRLNLAELVETAAQQEFWKNRTVARRASVMKYIFDKAADMQYTFTRKLNHTT